MMRVLSLEHEPFHAVRYAVGPSSSKGADSILPFHHGSVDGLPPGLDAVIAAADLQGFSSASPCEPLSMAVARALQRLQVSGILPGPDRIPCILAGDLHPRADVGDVRGAWTSFAAMCRWVAGVAGNHDAFSESVTAAAARLGPEMTLLDDSVVERDGLRIGGVSRIIGTTGGPWVRSEREFCTVVAGIAGPGLDALVCHDGPIGSSPQQPGWPSVRRVLEAAPATLVIRGHDAWRSPLAVLDNGCQVLNVESRVVVLWRR
jgi:hypothetical protein